MNNLKKGTLSLIGTIVILMAMSMSMVTWAAEKVDATTNFEYSENFYPGEIGATQKFQSTDDYPLPSARKTFRPGDLIYSTTHRDELGMNTYTESAYFSSKNLISQKFVKYLTTSWSKASSYTWSKTNTVSISGSGKSTIAFAKKVAAELGLSVSRSTSYSVAINLPADASRYSKLAFSSDYTKLVYNYKKYKNTDLMSSGTDTYYTPEKDTYLSVIYK